MYNSPKPVCRYVLTSELSNGSKLCYRGSRDGAVVRALAFHQCGPGSIPGPGVTCGLSLLLVLVLAPKVLFRLLRFSSLHKNQNFQIPIRPGRQVFAHEPLAREIRRLLFVIVRSERDISAAILVAKFACIEGLEEVTLISSKYLGTLLPIILSGDRLQFLMPWPDKNESLQLVLNSLGAERRSMGVH